MEFDKERIGPFITVIIVCGAGILLFSAFEYLFVSREQTWKLMGLIGVVLLIGGLGAQPFFSLPSKMPINIKVHLSAGQIMMFTGVLLFIYGISASLESSVSMIKLFTLFAGPIVFAAGYLLFKKPKFPHDKDWIQ